MKEQKDRHLETPGEANRDKHINFLAAENGDVDPADESFNDSANKDVDDTSNVDNGFFTDDDNSLQTKEEYEHDKNSHSLNEKQKVLPLEPDTTPTLGDKITVDDYNEDIFTPVKDDNPDSFAKDDDKAH